MASWVICISLIIINIISNILSHCSCQQRTLTQSRQVWMDFSPERNWDPTETVTDVTKWLVTWEEVPVSPRSSCTGHRLTVTVRNTTILLMLHSERSKHYWPHSTSLENLHRACAHRTCHMTCVMINAEFSASRKFWYSAFIPPISWNNITEERNETKKENFLIWRFILAYITYNAI